MGKQLCDGDCPSDDHIHLNLENGGYQTTFRRSPNSGDTIVLDSRLDREGQL